MLAGLTVDCLTVRCSWGPLLSTSATPSLSIPWSQRTQDIIRWSKKSCTHLKADNDLFNLLLGSPPTSQADCVKNISFSVEKHNKPAERLLQDTSAHARFSKIGLFHFFVLPWFWPPPPQAASFLCSPVGKAEWSLYKLCESSLLCILWENSTGSSVDLSEEYFVVTLQWGLMMSCQGQL